MHKIDAKQQPFAAAFHFLYSSDDKPKYRDELASLPVILYGDSITSLSEIIEKLKNQDINLIEVYNDSSIYLNQAPPPPPLNEKTLVLKNNHITSLIILFATHNGLYWQERFGYDNSQFHHSRSFAWSNKDIQPVDDEVFREILHGKTNSFDIGNRIFFPAWGEYRKLAVNTSIPWARFYRRTGASTKYLVLPCKFKNNERAEIKLESSLLSWSYSNLENKNQITKEEHENLYTELTELLNRIQNFS